MEKNNKKLFVSEIVVNNKQLKRAEETLIINDVRDKMLHILLSDGIDEAVMLCNTIIKQRIDNEPLKGNITYSFVRTEDEMNIEFVRYAHGGGNNSSIRITGGVVVATLKTIQIKGELSKIHGLKFYQNNNPLNFL